jgi:hypothetical protein
MMCGTYGANPQLLPTSRTKETTVPQTIKRVPGGAEGHYAQWVEASIAGPGKMEVSSPFETAGPLTEALLMANLAIRAHDVRTLRQGTTDRYDFPGRGLKLVWDNEKMRVTNFDPVNQFVKREYRQGYSLKV